MATSETSSTLLHKILIPVITTVLGATAIYFLGFNRKSSASAAEIEKVTVDAWQSFVRASNTSYKLSKSVSSEYEEKLVSEVKEKGISGIAPVLREFQDELLKISKKANSDVDIILKNENIDGEFVSMLTKMKDNSEDEEKKTVEYVDDLVALVKSNLDEKEKGEKWAKKAAAFEATVQKSEDREATEAEDIAATLSKKYNRPFNLDDLDIYVDYKKEKAKKDAGEKTNTPTDVNKPIDNNGQAPADPDKGVESKENIQQENKPASNTSSGNQREPTESLLAGQWQMTGGILELSRNGDMYWTFDGKGFTSGDWKLVDGKLRMNATNPDTKKRSELLGFISDFSGSSFTMTFMTTPKEVYHFTKKKDY